METTAVAHGQKPALTPERKEWYARIATKGVAPLWEVLNKIIPPHPTPDTLPVIFRYDELRPILMEAGRLLTAMEAERRVLILENPAFRGQSKATQSLYAGLQLIMPGEIAPCHRHVACALRFVVEGTGAYTAVEGERTMMHPGDFILTPSWTYHDHGNPGEEPVVWMDGLDIPIVNTFDTSFIERYPDEVQPHTIPEGDAYARYGANLLPVDFEATRKHSPIFNYPYSRTRETLDEMFRNGMMHPCHGVKMRYANPANGWYPMPTIGAFIQLLPKGFSGQPYRATDSTVYSVVEGKGRTRIGDETFTWKAKDIFVVPSWAPVTHETDGESVLFSFSDRPAQKTLGLWREEAPINL
ncbi:MAG: gentisate 1,2-dioxygenase [Acidimicrobiia bacterium]|nr:gentisate 1,2-dioxygenase [Acidimicrobiia bacterium]